MRDLPRSARFYLLGCYALGLVATFWLVGRPSLSFHYDQRDLFLAVVLGALAAIAQIFIVARTKGHHSDHLTPAPVFAAILLLPPPLLALVIACAFIPEWVIYRRRWFIQVFNIAAWMMAAAAARAIIEHFAAQGRLTDGEHVAAGVVLASLLAFLTISTLALAVVLRLARRQSLRDTGLFVPVKLFSEVALLSSGWAFAAAWVLDPFYAIPAALPLLIIFQALHVPNLIVEATTDPKTGLANMRQVNLVLAREFERAERTGQPGSILMCDLDFLRNINNTYGHAVGDLVLCGVADAIRHSVRACDLAGRFGGEEFIVFLQDTPRDAAHQVAERIRKELERQRFSIGEGNQTISASVSIGVATFPEDGGTIESLMREADLALYQAKREGRNRVVVAGRSSRELVGEWARDNFMPARPVPQGSNRLGILRFGANTAFNQAQPGTEGEPSEPAVDPGDSAEPVAEPAPQLRPPRPEPQPRSVGLFIAVCAGVASLLLVHGIGAALDRSLPWQGLAFFAAIVIFAQQLAVDIDGRSQTSVVVVPILGATFLYNELGILTAGLAFAIWAKLRAHSPIHRMIFNFAMIAIAASMADGTFNLLTGGSIHGHSFERMFIPGVLAGLVYYVTNHLLLSMVRGLNEGRSTLEVLRADYQWLWPHYAVFGALGMTMAVAYVTFGWSGVIALTAPVAMMRVAIKQYMERTAVYVAELKLVNQRLTDSYEATLQALSRALDTRDEETEEHSQRVRRYSQLIARHYGLSEEEIEHLSRGALLHDIGKIGVPDAILLKKGRLTPEETEQMRRHPTIGFTMIAHIPFLAKAAEVVLHHHEAFDGSGYPSGLGGHRIPLGARIFTVVDALDAMTSNRPYRAALPFEEALEEIRRCSGSQFDPHIVDVLTSIPLDELKAAHTRDAGDVMETSPAPLIVMEEVAAASD